MKDKRIEFVYKEEQLNNRFLNGDYEFKSCISKNLFDFLWR